VVTLQSSPADSGDRSSITLPDADQPVAEWEIDRLGAQLANVCTRVVLHHSRVDRHTRFDLTALNLVNMVTDACTTLGLSTRCQECVTIDN